MQHILLCTDGSAFSQTIYRYAAWLTPRLDAEVDVLFVTDIRGQKAASSENLSGSLGLGASRELLTQLVEIEHEKAKINHKRTQLILAEAKKMLQESGVTRVNLIHETGFLVDIFHEFEAKADLIVLGKRGEHAEFASSHLGSNVERIVRASHKPCLVTTRDFQPIRRLLLAYDGSQSCRQMLDFLVTSPAFTGLDLHILTARKKGAEDLAAQRLAEAETIAKNAGFDPVCYTETGNSETVISQYIETQGIDLLLMGAYGHSRLRHLVIGSTTVQMLRRSSVPVLLFR
ncbi:MAG: universal stress protein [Jaaginema sp. PMC 1079.18]|nr:universal stress protein [Jaaginema sp. PMC 1080.18]MEC4850265.1 universal stress protein [Jaaginema sp. PMC 1079.18]MEC4866909.1 universal stress protein [Jaaginema sp. PMC 1078.18]